MPSRHFLIISVTAIALVACQREAEQPANEGLPQSGPITEAPAVPLSSPDGTIIGSVHGGDSDEGAVLRIEARGLPAGVHGLHLHTVGICEGPNFESAGPHWNPTHAQHGLQNPQGPHLGDLPNITVAPDGTFTGTVTIQNSYLKEGRGRIGPSEQILDADGAALIIHAGPDDNRTDPSGNSGARIACAALTG